MSNSVALFLADLVRPALFEAWGAAGVAVLLTVACCACGLLLLPKHVGSPALRALAGFPFLFLAGGAVGVLVYLAGGTVRASLDVLLILSAGLVIAALWYGVLRELLQWRALALFGGLLLISFALAFFGWGETRDGTVRAMSGAWGDGPLHTLIAEALLRRSGGDLSMPAFAGEKLREPFGYDFGAAMLRAAGFTVGGAFTLPAAAFLACLLGWSGALAVRLAGQKTARLTFAVAALLVLTFGGFQWAEMAQRTSSWAPARFFGVHEPAWNKSEELGLIWANHVNTFVSQRHLLLAAAFLLVLAAMLLSTVQCAGDVAGGSPRRGQSDRGPFQKFLKVFWGMAADRRQWGDPPRHPRALLPFAIATGLLPLFHTHAFLAAGLLWIGAVFASRSRLLVGLGVLAALVAAPIVLWQATLFSRAGFLSLAPGWMASGGLFGWCFFWLKNLGLFGPLAVLAVTRGYRREQRSTILLALPAVILFALANIIQFQPYRWDNFKLLLLAWLLLLPLTVAEMIRWQFVGARILTGGLVLVMSLTTLSDLATHLKFRVAYPVYTSADRAVAHRLEKELPSEAVVLARTDVTHNHPLTLTGRTLLAGYGGWLWSRNFAWTERAALVESLWSADRAQFCTLATRAGITHVVDAGFRVRSVAAEC
ncbi:MAG: hypothetical protein G01um101438_785 [Parcubacteria group bacterium Gr01-1014_38]|nr:MAG: hypothetical protein G01um101438_785 [Parcubacteria group bacterium Gr01-1014_38]